MEYVNLENGLRMPILGFGCYQLRDPEECEEAVFNALQHGYRLIDTAASYGNEEAVGRAIRRSGIPREELFITTKLWIDDYGEKSTPAAYERSLRRLDLDYLDLYLLHQPFGDVYGAWRALEKLYDNDEVKAIGVSNFYPDRLLDLCLRSQIKPVVDQIEINPFCQQLSNVESIRSYGVQAEAWSPLATGLGGIFENEALRELSVRYDRSIAQIVLRWVLQRGIVVIPKAARREHMEEDFDVFSFELSPEDMDTITAINREESVYFGKESHRDPETVRRFAGMHFST